MSANVIKEFLVSLGFNIDGAGQKKFESALVGATKKAVQMGIAVEGAALSVFAFTTKIASALDNLYWMSQRTGATVEGIKSIGYAVSQMGGTADAARGSLENLARFVRNNPGAESFLNRLGVQTRDGNGHLRDMSGILSSVGQKLSSMPYYRANQYAQILGIDENTLMAMRRGIGQFSADYERMLKVMNYDPDKAAASSNRFMTALRALSSAAGMARDKIGSTLANGLTGSLEQLRKQFLDNFPAIEKMIMRGAKAILWLGDALFQLGYRLIQAASELGGWWSRLDRDSKRLIAVLGGLVVAWRILNAEMWKSPITWVLALAGAIALLWDDYKTWKEGGNSLIDWAKWEPLIKKAMQSLGWIRDRLIELKDKLGGWKNTLELLFGLLVGAKLARAVGGVGKITTAFLGLGKAIGGALAGTGKLAASIAGIVAKNPWLLMFVPTNNTPGTAQELAPLGGVGANFDTDKIKAVQEWQAAHPNDPYPEKGVNLNENTTGNLPDRNNNPGNLRPVGGAGFRKFGSAIEGWNAMKNQLMRYYNGKTTGNQLRTIYDIVKTWAPSGDNNNPKQYADQVARWMGTAPTALLNLSNPNTMAALMQAMARKEGYSNWNSPQAKQAAGVQIQQHNTYNISGENAQQIGNEVEQRQQSANAKTMRGNQVKVG